MNFYSAMDNSSFGIIENIAKSKKNNNIINIICISLIIILIIVLFICLFKNCDNFNNEKSHMYLVVRDGCGYASKTLEQFKKNNMMLGKDKLKIIDLSQTEKILGKELSQKIGGATPAIVCTGTNKVLLGYRPNIEDYLKELQTHSENNNTTLLVGNLKCPFCIKAKNLMEELKINYKFIDSNSPQGSELMEENKSNAVPLIILPNGKVINGFDEVEIRKI